MSFAVFCDSAPLVRTVLCAPQQVGQCLPAGGIARPALDDDMIDEPAFESAAPAPQDARDDTGLAPKTRTPRTGTKQAKLIEMLRAEGGATIDEIVAALQWRPHTVRGALAGALKKRLGLTIVSETVDGRGRIYKIIA